MSSRPDLVVLDVMLPGFDGLEVMRRLHADLDGRVPVILLTAKGEEADRLVGLRSGADDYVVKPFSPAELVARVDAVLRRTRGEDAAAEPLRFGELEIDPSGRSVTVGGQRGRADPARVRPAALPGHATRARCSAATS